MAPGTLVDERYRVRGRLGAGGMSVVYRAHDEQLGREVALKMFRPAMVDLDDDRRRRGEVRVLATLQHPKVVTLFDARLDGDLPYLTTEFVDGDDLGERLRAGVLPADDLVPLTAAISDALAFMHERGVVHRDVKPANILLPRDPSPSAPFAKLADFGIARLVDGSRSTATGTVIGTAAYLSPEQAGGREAGPPSDIYSLGLVLIECVSGAMPFPGSAAESAAARLTRSPDVPESLPHDWRSLLARMTERDPSDRPTAAEVFGSSATLGAPYAKTLILPAVPAADDVTERLVGPAPSATRVALPSPVAPPRVSAPQPTAVAGALRRTPGRRLAIGIATAALAALVVVIAVVWSLPHSTTAAPSQGTSYPTVSGDLGDHLAELQRSVAP